MMNKINIIGTIIGTSGYDIHTRSFFNALYKINPDIKLDVPLPQDWIKWVSDAELDAITKPFRIPDVTIMIATPPCWRLALSDGCKKFIGFLVWEGSNIPKYWLEYLLDERVSQIWVPSRHTFSAVVNTIEDIDIDGDELLKAKICSKIKIVPHGIDLSLFKPIETKRDIKFTFLYNKGWRGTSWDRGGVQYLIKAFSEEFRSNENVQLLLKLNPAYLHPSQLKQSMDNLNLPQDRAQIKIITDNVPYNKLIELYNMGDVYVCPTRAESFDLGSAEAMSCGLPIITTNYGGQIEHTNNDNSWFVDYKLEEIKEDINYEGVSWATPNNEDLRKKMRYCFEHQDEVKEKGKKSEEFIKTFTWDETAKKALEYLNSMI